MKKTILLSIVLLLTACATAVNVDYQPGTNFTAIKSFSVDAKPVAIANDPRINSPFTQQRITEALTSQLKQKGLVVKKDKPAVIVKYHLGLKQEAESDSSGLSFGIGSSSSHSAFGFVFGPGTEVSTVDNLVITVDMSEPVTNKLLWRGSFQSRLASGITPESSSKLINAMIKEILDQFPPK